MINKVIDKKQPTEDTDLAKENNDPKRNYIFQKNTITKNGIFYYHRLFDPDYCGNRAFRNFFWIRG